jgi:hypothetical protein
MSNLPINQVPNSASARYIAFNQTTSYNAGTFKASLENQRFSLDNVTRGLNGSGRTIEIFPNVKLGAYTTSYYSNGSNKVELTQYDNGGVLMIVTTANTKWAVGKDGKTGKWSMTDINQGRKADLTYSKSVQLVMSAGYLQLKVDGRAVNLPTY